MSAIPLEKAQQEYYYNRAKSLTQDELNKGGVGTNLLSGYKHIIDTFKNEMGREPTVDETYEIHQKLPDTYYQTIDTLSTTKNPKTVEDTLKGMVIGGLQSVYPDAYKEATVNKEKTATELQAEKERATGEATLSRVQGLHTDRSRRLADLLGQTSKRIFTEESPDILEGLNKLNLLHSSAVGSAFAKERGRLGQLSQDIIAQQELGDVDSEVDIVRGMNEAETEMGRAGLGREFSIDDFFRSIGLENQNWGNQYNIAKMIADSQNSASKRGSKYALYGDILQGLITGATVAASDKRLKKNIVKLGIRQDGLNVYSFNYIWDNVVKHIGFMADEVKKVYPKAVKNVDGYDYVNYAMIGG